MLESVFQSRLIARIKEQFPGAVVLKNDPNYIQGFPDLLVLFENKWAALECKKASSARLQVNQQYYVDLLDDMSFASFVSPDNEEEVLNGLQSAFRSRRKTRIS